MPKMTPRQEKILEALAGILSAEVEPFPPAAAKGIMFFSIETACRQWNIELSEAEEFEPDKRRRFFGDLMDDVRRRLARYHVPEDKVEKIKEALYSEYMKH